MRYALAVIVVAAVGVAFYLYRQDAASGVVKREMLAIVEDMGLGPDAVAEVQRMVETFHDEYYSRAMDVSKKLGRKFDESAYYNQLVDHIVGVARDSGLDEIADRLALEKDSHRLVVSEQ